MSSKPARYSPVMAGSAKMKKPPETGGFPGFQAIEGPSG
jgi:hypothetical protein